MSSKKTHAFIKIGRDIGSGNISDFVLLCGREEYLVDFYSKKLMDMYINPVAASLDMVTLSRNEVTPELIIQNIETVSMMSERKVVYVPEFIDAKGKLPKNFQKNEEMLGELIEYIKTSLMGSCEHSGQVLLLMTYAWPGDERAAKDILKNELGKAAAEAGGLYNFDTLNAAQVRSFIEKRFRDGGRNFAYGLADFIAKETGYLNDSVDYGLYNLNNDLKKIIAYAEPGKEITKADVFSVITVNPENDVFAMIDAVGKGRKDEAFRLLHNLIADGNDIFRLLSLITGQLEIMLMTCEMKEKGMRLEDMQRLIKKLDKTHEYRVKKAFQTVDKFTKDKLKEMLAGAFEVNWNIKSGLIPDTLALEYFIGRI